MRKRILTSTFFLVMLFAAASVGMHQLFERATNGYDRVVCFDLPLQNAVGQVRLLLERQRALLMLLSVREDPALTEEFLDVSDRLRGALAHAEEQARRLADSAREQGSDEQVLRSFRGLLAVCLDCEQLHGKLFAELASGESEQARHTFEILSRRLKELQASMAEFDEAVNLRSRNAAATASKTDRVFHWLFIGMIVVSTLLGLAFNVFFYRALLPLEEMVAAVRRVARGDYEVRIPDRAKDELSHLARELNTMGEALRRQRSALEESQKVIRATFDGIDDAVVVHGLNGQLLHANPAAWKLVRLLEQDRPSCFREVLGLSHQCSDPVAHAMEGRCERCERRRQVVHEPRLNRDYEISCQPVLADHGALRLVVELVRDITAELQAERMQRQNEKLTAIGGVALGIAHELRNPLSTIQITLHALERREDLRPTESERIQLALREVDRLERLVSSLLDYGRPSSLRLQRLPAEEILQRAADLVETELLGRGVGVEIEPVKPASLTLEVDPDQTLQVLVNLLTNAAQASEPGGVVHLDAHLQERWKGGSAVVITVADSGSGIEAGALESVFTPFFTTRRNGTGLGLPLARKIAESHGGELDLESTAGSGTTARLALPVSRPSAAAGGLLHPRGGGETV